MYSSIVRLSRPSKSTPTSEADAAPLRAKRLFLNYAKVAAAARVAAHLAWLGPTAAGRLLNCQPRRAAMLLHQYSYLPKIVAKLRVAGFGLEAVLKLL